MRLVITIENLHFRCLKKQTFTGEISGAIFGIHKELIFHKAFNFKGSL